MYVRRKQEQNRNQIVREVNAGLAFSPTFTTVETMRDFTVGICGLLNLNKAVILLAPHLDRPTPHPAHFYCGKDPQNLWFLCVIYPTPRIHL